MIGKNGLLVLLGIVALLLLVNACSNLRKLSYPESLVYVQINESHGPMQRMSVVFAGLDDAMEDALILKQGHSQVLLQLETLDLICAELEGDNFITNHTVMDDNIVQFRNDIAHARRMVSAVPSNYYYVGKLSGTCAACHQTW